MENISNNPNITTKSNLAGIEGVTRRNNECYEYVFSDEDMLKMSQMKYEEDRIAYKQDLILKNKFKIKKVTAEKPTYNTSIKVKQGDITKLNIESIVNAANTSLLGGGGVDGAIHRAAGEDLLKECRALNGCEVGYAKITRGYKLPAQYIIHAVGPIWNDGTKNEEELLKNCYLSILNLAKEYEIKELAIPAISCGAYKFPLEKATKIAVDTVNDFVQNNKCFKEIIFIDTNPNVVKSYLKHLKK